MGAKFSKPLVANKVTHLICYKFEGLSNFRKSCLSLLTACVCFYCSLNCFILQTIHAYFYFVLFVNSVLKFNFQYRREVSACQEIGHNKAS